MITRQDNPNNVTRTEYILEPKDFDYLADEFNAVEDILGIELISKSDPKLCIKLHKHEIYYDRDISSRRMMIATERVNIRVGSMLSRFDENGWYQKYIPKTTEQLSNLINEFKYRPFLSVKEDEVINFISNSLVV